MPHPHPEGTKLQGSRSRHQHTLQASSEADCSQGTAPATSGAGPPMGLCSCAAILAQGCREGPHLVGQVATQVLGTGIIKAEGEAHVAMAKEDHVRHGTGDEQVGTHVELLPIQQQWVLDVPGGHPRAEHTAPTQASSSVPPPLVPGATCVLPPWLCAGPSVGGISEPQQFRAGVSHSLSPGASQLPSKGRI